MFSLRFSQVFFGLMALSLLSAFAAPARLSQIGRSQLSGLFIPVSRPAYVAANWLRHKFYPPTSADLRQAQDIQSENLALRQEITRLQEQVKYLRSAAGERQSLGDLMSMCEQFTVSGTDADNNDGLMITGPALANVRVGQAVLRPGELVGRIDRAGSGAAHVRLITDLSFVVVGRFKRLISSNSSATVVDVASKSIPIVNGLGNGQMAITNLDYEQVNGQLKQDDWVVVDDQKNWNQADGLIIGHILSIQRWPKAPLFAEILLEPKNELMHLNDVFVMTKAN